MPGEASLAIEVRNLWKVFGSGLPDLAITSANSGATRSEILQQLGQTVAVRDVSFSVARGETFVVMGLSGSGKSTLIRCLSRLIEPTRGEVLLDGEDLLAMDNKALREVRRGRISMVFQHFGLFPHRKVIDNIAYGLEVQGMSKAKRIERATSILNIVGLSGWAEHYPQQLSGGMQQRVGLGRALAVEPEILLFDEPFSALDPLIRREMQDELCRLQESMQRTIIFITHDFAEALRLGDRIAIMKDGSFDQVGTPEEIVTRPATDYVREFTTDIPRAKVLTVRSVAVAGTASNGGRSVRADTRVERVIPMLLDNDEPINVIDDDGRAIGIVNRISVAKLLQDEQR
ncbi:MAG: glycine betaine/L-proline ABC transporter ATP-binding protein [Ilumatobacteraceae bacterium]